MNSLVGSSISPLNYRNVCYPSIGYSKSCKKIVTLLSNSRNLVSCSTTSQNLKPSDELCSSKFNDSSLNLFSGDLEETDVLIECKDVYKSFGEKHILKGVNFKIKYGEAVGIIGPSGTGKSTILKIIAWLLTPDKGEVYIRGRKRHGLISDDDMSGLRIGLVFQSAALFDSLTVRENVGFLLYEHSRMPEDQIKELVTETLAAVGLKVLLYDEPTAGLDPIASTVVEDLIRSVHCKGEDALGKPGKIASYVVVTHQHSTIRRAVDRLVFLHEGKVVWEGMTHEFTSSTNPIVQQNEYYSCDATYRNWLQIELDNAGIDISIEEKQRAYSVAMETLSSSMALLLREENPWLVPTEDQIYELVDPISLELHATAMLCLPSGECMLPDATLCTALTSALYSSVSDEVVNYRQLQVSVSISAKDSCSVEVALRCLATENDGFGPDKLADGGVLAAVIAAGIKGELARFQAGVTMEILKLDAWYCGSDGSLGNPATYIPRGLCRRCCIPELILRCMQVSVSVMESGSPHERHDELIELVAGSETGFLHLFSQNQLQEFLVFEREYSISKMELSEE